MNNNKYLNQEGLQKLIGLIKDNDDKRVLIENTISDIELDDMWFQFGDKLPDYMLERIYDEELPNNGDCNNLTVNLDNSNWKEIYFIQNELYLMYGSTDCILPLEDSEHCFSDGSYWTAIKINEDIDDVICLSRNWYTGDVQFENNIVRLSATKMLIKTVNDRYYYIRIDSFCDN